MGCTRTVTCMKPRYREKFERAVLDESEEDPRWLFERASARATNGPGIGRLATQPIGHHGVGDWIERYLPFERWCDYCHKRLDAVFVDALAQEDEEFGEEPVRPFSPTPREVLARLSYEVDPVYRLWTCVRCGFWQWCSLELPPRAGPCEAAIVTPIVRTFEDVLPGGCAGELAQQIARQKGRLCDLSPGRLEKLVADVFRANHEHGEVRHVGRPGDGGMDVLLIDDGAREWLIQVKRRASVMAVEGVETVRSLLGAMIVEGKPRGVVVTTADHFSHFAHVAALRATAQSRGLITDVQLLDRHLLERLVGTVIPTDGWLNPLREGLVCRPANIGTLTSYCEGLLRQRARQLELF